MDALSPFFQIADMALRLKSWLSVFLPTAVRLVLGNSSPPNSICSSAGVYNTSFTPDYLPWNTYNYCNAPHVNVEHYETPSNAADATLVYMNVVLRHHKVSDDALPIFHHAVFSC